MSIKLVQAVKMMKVLFGAVKLTQEPLIDKTLIQYDGSDIEVGEVIYLRDGSEDWSILPDGLYETASGTKFTIADGVVSDVTKALVQNNTKDKLPPKQAQAAATSGITDEDSTEGTGAVDLSEDAKDENGKPKYGDVSYADSGLQDDKKKRYPIDTEEHIRAAWNYINKEKNQKPYSSESLQEIKNKIVAAWKEKIDKEGPPSLVKAGADDNPIVKPPAAGASDDLKNDPMSPEECMSKINDLHSKHNDLVEKFAALQKAHDDIKLAHDDIHKNYQSYYTAQQKHDSDLVEMQKQIDKLKGDGDSTNNKVTKMSSDLEVIKKSPSAPSADEIKNAQYSTVSEEVRNTKAYQMFNKS